MPYCENCGAELSAGARFCEECGAEVDSYNEAMICWVCNSGNGSQTICSTFIGDWKEKWANAAQDAKGGELGIIMTDVGALATQLSCSATDLCETIDDYARSAAERGVYYHLLDLDNNGISNILSLIHI